MMDANYISERLADMRREMNELKVTNARYCVKSLHTALDKSAHCSTAGTPAGDQTRVVGYDETLCLATIANHSRGAD